MIENKKYEICGCVETAGLSSRPVLCADCNFADEKVACEEEEREYYLYKEVKE